MALIIEEILELRLSSFKEEVEGTKPCDPGEDQGTRNPVQIGDCNSVEHDEDTRPESCLSKHILKIHFLDMAKFS